MIKSFFKKVGLLSFVTFILTGCLSEQPFIETKYYDLGISNNKIDIGNVFVDIGNFKTLGISTTKMKYRKEKNKILVDNYNKWILFPKDIIKRDLQLAFTGISSAKSNFRVYISGEVLLFESSENKSTLAIKYNIKNMDTSDSLTKIIKFETVINGDKMLRNYDGQQENIKKLILEISSAIKLMNE